MRTRKLTSLVMAAIMAAGTISVNAPLVMAEPSTDLSYDGYTQVWADEFNGDSLNRNDWNVELHDPGWVNSELQAYVDSEENIQVKDGNLYLNPVKKVETIETDVPSAGNNLLANADFTNGIDGWTETIANWSDDLAKATRTTANGAVTYDITQVGTEDWNIQLKQENLSLKAGVTYKASYLVTSSVARQIKSGVMSADYNWFGGSDPVLEAGVPTPVTFEFTMPTDCDTAQFYLSMGYCGEGTEPGTITISDISLTTEYVEDDTTTSTTTEKVSYTSGRVNTQNKQTFTYGLFEVRAKVPEGQGYLPAFWLMANDENIYGQWPRCGEIDCMEVMGQDTSKVYGTIHFGNPHSESQGTAISTVPSFSDDFHTFTTEWEPGVIRWYVDGKLYHEESSWYSTTEGQGTLTYPAPFDQPFYIILNLAVGGSWVGNPTDETSFDNNPYVIDYVRVYQKDEYDENVEAPVQEFNPRDPDENGNYITSNNSDWVFLTALGGEATADINNGNITIDTENAGSVDYSVQLVQANVPLEKGATYQVQFDASASANRTMNVDVKAPDHGYKAYMPTFNPQLTTETQTFTTTFVMKDASDENGRLEFNMGATDSTASIYLSNISIKKIADPDPNAQEEKTVLANGNYIYNGSFQEGTGHLGYWTISDPENASVTSFSDGRKLKIDAPLTISQDALTFKEGTPYAVSFYASTVSDGQVAITVGGQTFTAELDGNFKQYTFKIPSDAAFTDQDVTVSFTGNGPIYFDNVMLVEDSMIKNGSFNDGLTGYEVYVDSSAKASYVVDSLTEDNALDVTVNNTGDQDWKIQIKQNNVKLEQGKTYKLSLRAKSNLSREIRVIMQGLENKGWAVYSNDNIITLTDEYQTFTDVFTMENVTDEAAFLSICLGNVTGEITDQHRVVIDDIQLEEVTGEAEEPEVTAITKQPEDTNVTVGDAAVYSVEATNAASYQWQYSKNGTKWYTSAAAGNDTASITVNVVNATMDNQYRCVVTGKDGVVLTSEVARNVAADDSLKITAQPVEHAFADGKDVTYKVEASNVASYQWEYSKDGEKWYKTAVVPVQDEALASSEISLTVAASNIRNVYRCKVTGINGTTAYTKTVGITGIPEITAQPQNVTFKSGKTATLTVEVANAEDAVYQWYYSKDGTKWYMSGVEPQTATLSFTMKSTMVGTQYRCKITTGGMTLTSEAAVVE